MGQVVRLQDRFHGFGGRYVRSPRDKYGYDDADNPQQRPAPSGRLRSISNVLTML